MRYVRYQRVFSLVLGFVLAFGFATNNTLAANGTIKVSAEAVDEGIRVSFENIPSETTNLFLHISTSSGPAYSTRNIVSTYSDIRDSVLEQVKRTGRVVLPFVESGKRYIISASFEKDDELLTDDDYFAECTPYSGISFTGNMELRLNEALTVATLSGEPIFPVAVRFAPVKYDFRAFVDLYGIVSLSYSDKETVRGLTWNFEPLMTQYLIASGYLQKGNYPVYISAYCNLIHDNIPWTVEIAKSSEFTFSL